MNKTMNDVLDSPEILRRTQNVLALKKKLGDAQSGVAKIIADIGDELAATKAALDKTADKAAWLRWLSKHVGFARQSAENYMNLGWLRKKFPSGWEFFARLPLDCLYMIATLAEKLIHHLIIDPRLPDPKTGELVPMEGMSERDMKTALEIYKGRRNPEKSRKPAPDETREQLAREAFARLRDAMAAMEIVRDGAGKLSPDTKRAMLDELDKARKLALHWPAWVTPQKGRRLR